MISSWISYLSTSSTWMSTEASILKKNRRKKTKCENESARWSGQNDQKNVCVCALGFWCMCGWVLVCCLLCRDHLSYPETEKGGEKNKSGGIQSSFRFWRSYKLTVNWILVTIFFTTLARNSKTNPKFNKIRKNKTTNNN